MRGGWTCSGFVTDQEVSVVALSAPRRAANRKVRVRREAGRIKQPNHGYTYPLRLHAETPRASRDHPLARQKYRIEHHTCSIYGRVISKAFINPSNLPHPPWNTHHGLYPSQEKNTGPFPEYGIRIFLRACERHRWQQAW
jgi:hypothetical protein